MDLMDESMSTIKVLVAEDHLITRQGICRLLEDESSITVIGEAGDGEEAVQRLGKLGLTGIQERARLLDGTLQVESALGKGTTLMVEVST